MWHHKERYRIKPHIEDVIWDGECCLLSQNIKEGVMLVDVHSSSVPPTVCGETLLQGHFLINDWGWISGSDPPSLHDSCHEPIMRVQGRMTFTFHTHPHKSYSICYMHSVCIHLPRAAQGKISCDTVQPCHLWPPRKLQREQTAGLLQKYNYPTKRGKRGEKENTERKGKFQPAVYQTFLVGQKLPDEMLRWNCGNNRANKTKIGCIKKTIIH